MTATAAASQPAWTPGPWRVQEYSAVRGLTKIIISADERHIATVFSNDEAFYDETREGANARLIAAAPEMFEALKSCIVNLQGIADDEDIPSTVIMAKARAALAAAIGGAP